MLPGFTSVGVGTAGSGRPCAAAEAAAARIESEHVSERRYVVIRVSPDAVERPTRCAVAGAAP